MPSSEDHAEILASANPLSAVLGLVPLDEPQPVLCIRCPVPLCPPTPEQKNVQRNAPKGNDDSGINLLAHGDV